MWFPFLLVMDMRNHRRAPIHCFLYWRVSRCHKLDVYWSRWHCQVTATPCVPCHSAQSARVWQSQITCTLTAWSCAWIIYWAPDGGRIHLNTSSLRNILSWMNLRDTKHARIRTSMFYRPRLTVNHLLWWFIKMWFKSESHIWQQISDPS